MKNKNLEFQISQLRQDKIIYAVEAVAINITCLVVSSLFGLVVSLSIVPEAYLFYGNIAIFVIGIGYTIYMLLGNLARLKKIKQLESEL
jgi:hypothetical protein